MIWKEAFRFGVVGLAQLLLDWVVFVALSAAGAPVASANIGGRVTGAILGYTANARFTFAARRRRPLDRGSLLRFVAVWTTTTLLSTAAMAFIDLRLGLEGAWLLKPVVDVGLVGLSFLASRHWVYR